MNKAFSALCLLAVLLVTGCERKAPSWLRGNWTFDQAYTEQKLAASNSSGESQSFGDKMVAAGKKLLTPMVIEGMKGKRLTVNDTDIIVFKSEDNGTDFKYEVLDSSDPNTAILKQTGGPTPQVVMYHRDGDRIWTGPSESDDANFATYYKRAQ